MPKTEPSKVADEGKQKLRRVAMEFRKVATPMLLDVHTATLVAESL